MEKKNKRQSEDELDMSNLNETVEETERRRDAESNLSQLKKRGPASPSFDAPFAPGVGSTGMNVNDEDEYTESGNERTDLGDGSQVGGSDFNDISGNPEVYNEDEQDDYSEGGMSIDHTNEIAHGTQSLKEEIKQHEAKRTAERVRFKKGTPISTVTTSSDTKPLAKKATPKKKTVKKTVKKAVVKKKAAPKKKTVKKSTTKKASAATKRKAAPKKKTVTKKKSAPKSAKKTPARKSSPARKGGAKKKTTKRR